MPYDNNRQYGALFMPDSSFPEWAVGGFFLLAHARFSSPLQSIYANPCLFRIYSLSFSLLLFSVRVLCRRWHSLSGEPGQEANFSVSNVMLLFGPDWLEVRDWTLWHGWTTTHLSGNTVPQTTGIALPLRILGSGPGYSWPSVVRKGIWTWCTDSPLGVRWPPQSAEQASPSLNLSLDMRSMHLSITLHSGLCVATGMGTLSQNVPRTDLFVGRLLGSVLLDKTSSALCLCWEM